MTGEPDFGLDDLQPTDIASELAERDLRGRDLTVLADHHSTDGLSRSCLVAHDASATWGAPGAPQLVAVDITRDHDHGTFTCATSAHATMAFAQQWLITRGCPPAAITQVSPDLIQPADDATLRVEEQVRASGERYEVLSTYTSELDDPTCWSWTMVRDRHADDAPIRAFLEDVDLRSATYTLRQAAFPDQPSARRWLDNRDAMRAIEPERGSADTALRAQAALSRSTSVSHVPPTTGLWEPAAPTASTSREHHSRGPK